jgi:hypothetical protein
MMTFSDMVRVSEIHLKEKNPSSHITAENQINEILGSLYTVHFLRSFSIRSVLPPVVSKKPITHKNTQIDDN